MYERIQGDWCCRCSLAFRSWFCMRKFSYTCKVLAEDYSREFPAGLLSIRLEFCEKSSHRVSYLSFCVAIEQFQFFFETSLNFGVEGFVTEFYRELQVSHVSFQTITELWSYLSWVHFGPLRLSFCQGSNFWFETWCLIGICSMNRAVGLLAKNSTYGCSCCILYLHCPCWCSVLSILRKKSS